jgi:hypothetical protein
MSLGCRDVPAPVPAAGLAPAYRTYYHLSIHYSPSLEPDALPYSHGRYSRPRRDPAGHGGRDGHCRFRYVYAAGLEYSTHPGPAARGLVERYSE